MGILIKDAILWIFFKMKCSQHFFTTCLLEVHIKKGLYIEPDSQCVISNPIVDAELD